MTLSELTALCFQKIDEKNPLRLPDTPKVVHSPEEEQVVLNEIVDQYAAKCDYSSMLMHAISAVYSTLYQELGLSREEVQKLPADTTLPPRTNALAEKLHDFPEEITERFVPHIIWLEDCFRQHEKRYVYFGPFPSSSATNKWLEDNGFEEQRLGLWVKTSPSEFNPQGGVTLAVPALQAWIEILKTPEQLRFVPNPKADRRSPVPAFKKFYEPEVQVSEVEQAKEELNAFMQTDDWRGFLTKLTFQDEMLRVHKYDDACSHHEAVYLTKAGFINAAGWPIEDLTEVIEGFLFEHMHDKPPCHPSQFIPWLKASLPYQRWKSGR